MHLRCVEEHSDLGLELLEVEVRLLVVEEIEE
jgi:hypothetical protein